MDKIKNHYTKKKTNYNDSKCARLPCNKFCKYYLYTYRYKKQFINLCSKKVDAKLLTEIQLGTSHVDVTPAIVPLALTLPELNKARIAAFGDKMNDADVCFMHSLQYLDIVNDSGTGMLKADANDPAIMVGGFQGRFLGMAIVVADSTPVIAGAGALQEYGCTFHKLNSYGIMEKQMMEFDEDKDILARERIFTSNQWYAVKSFHGKVAADDLRTGRLRTKATANV